MSVLNELSVSLNSGPYSVKEEVRRAMWRWFHQHQDDVILKKWFFSIYVHDLHAVFVQLFGADA